MDQLAKSKVRWMRGLVGVACLAGGLLAPASADASTIPLPWQVVSVGSKQRSLILAVGPLYGCSKLQAKVLVENSATIKLSLQNRTHVPPAGCAEPGVLEPPFRYEIKLKRRVNGQRITGAKRTTKLLDLELWRRWSHGAANAPNLVGLKTGDAANVLGVLGVDRGSISYSGPHPGIVVSQSPAPGLAFDTSTPVALTTKPAHV